MADGPVLSSEMVSGPDLGGGFLHQLTLDRGGEGTTFTHHAQDGGQDAGGPPRGPLDVFGFVHPPSPCMFGGPRCWHRRYLLPSGELPRVRFAYQRCRFALASMLAQVYDGAPVPVLAVLGELARRVAPALEKEGIPWYVGGSTAGLLLGGALRPRDIDLGTTRKGVDRLGELLSDYLIEPVGPTDWGPERLVRGARAFVGSPQHGARVEWSVPLERVAVPLGEFDGEPGRVSTVPAEVDGIPLRVSRPEYGLLRARERGRNDVLPAWIELLRRVGPNRELLEGLFERSRLSFADQSELRAELAR